MSRNLAALVPLIRRYAQAGGGPIATAAAHFLLSFALLHAFNAVEFGVFSFLLIVSQLSWGIWSALFCAPLPAFMHGTYAMNESQLDGLFAANLLGALLSFFVFFLIGWLLGVALIPSIFFSIYGAAALLRWFARSYSYAVTAPGRALVSDLVYCIGLLLGISVVLAGESNDLSFVYGVMAASTLAGLIPFGRPFMARQFAVKWSQLPLYRLIWRRYAGWSLTGVITTELTANAHAYLITFIYGPAAFSVVAATALLTRPVGVAMNGLTEFERARMARQLAVEGQRAAFHGARVFRAILLAAWLGNVALAGTMLFWEPKLIFPSAYEITDIVLGTILWFIVAGVRVLRTAESVLLQAAGEFRPLAFASVISAVFSLIAVAGLAYGIGVLWSIAGVALGELTYAALIWRALLRWRTCNADSARLDNP